MTTGLARVDAREAELLAIARALVTPGAYVSVAPTLASSVVVTELGPTAMRLLTDTLSKGVVKMLARLGGARLRIRADTGSTSAARVFDVRPPPALAFGRYTFELLRWLVSKPLGSDVAAFDATPTSLGDEVCAYLALRLVEGERLERAVASSPGLRTPLTWLGFARSLARHGGAGVTAPSMDALVATEDARTVVECVGDDLARRWTKTASWDPADVLPASHAVEIGTLERAAIDGFLDALERTGRWDLATFLVEAGARVLPLGARPRDVAARAAPRVRAEGTLRARTESRRLAGALFHALARVGRRREELALVRFIDDGYDVAQATLSSWEMFGREAFVRASGVVSALASLDDLHADAGHA